MIPTTESPEERAIDEAVKGSFPASDPPSSNLGHAEPAIDSTLELVLDTFCLRDAAGFAEYCARDARLRLGAEVHQGREAIIAALGALFTPLAELHKETLGNLSTPSGALIEATLRCRWSDGHEAPVQFALVVRPALPSFADVHIYWSSRLR